MEEIYINPDWTFKEAVEHLKTLKAHYKGNLASFLYFQLKEKVEFKRKIRNAIYSLKMEEWKKDKIWNYMNDYEFYYVLKGISNRLK